MVLRPLVIRNGSKLFSSAFRIQMYKFSTTGTNRQDKVIEKGVGTTLPPPDVTHPSPLQSVPEKRRRSEDDVIFESHSGGKALIELNRPRQLNTLNTSMVMAMRRTLLDWKSEKYFIYLKGAGPKAFCAGGDVVAITTDATGETGKQFFCEEYKLDALISSLTVPFASMLNGIVMGGGVGISLFGKYRIATENSMFAMPETLIGFFPDVGVSYHLARMPNKVGTFLALTGYRLKGYDLVHAGIATHFCASADVQALEDSLLCDFQKSLCSSHDEIIKEFQEKALRGLQPPPFSLAEHASNIKRWFSADSVEEAMTRISQDKTAFAAETMATLKKTSPLSLKVTFKQIALAKEKEIFDCFNTDYRIALRMLRNSDFKEGVRAMLVDKDKRPRWKYVEVGKVPDAEVDLFFSPLEEKDELNLPANIHTPCY